MCPSTCSLCSGCYRHAKEQLLVSGDAGKVSQGGVKAVRRDQTSPVLKSLGQIIIFWDYRVGRAFGIACRRIKVIVSLAALLGRGFHSVERLRWMLCVRTGASQSPADVDAAEHARRRFARHPEPEKTRETF